LRNRLTVIVTGALTGGLLALALLALFAGRFSMSGMGLSDGGTAQLSVTTGALYLAGVGAALIGGAVVAAVTYGATADTRPGDTMFALRHVMPFALVVAVAASYSVLRAGLGLSGDTVAGVITVHVAELAITTLLSGLVAGALVAWIVSTLAAKSIVGLEGEAAPASTAAMLRAATRAVTAPLLAIILIAALAIAFSQLLLAAEGTAAIAIFGGAAALVLLGATGAAYLGGPRNGKGAAS
jgi:hypothetical protein